MAYEVARNVPEGSSIVTTIAKSTSRNLCDQVINNLIEKENLFNINGRRLFFANTKGLFAQILVDKAKGIIGGMFTRK